MKMLRAALTTFLTCACAAQYAQTRQSNIQEPPIEPIPAWYQIPKSAQAAPSYYERREPPPYERMIQHSNAYSNYAPSSYGSRPYEPIPSSAAVIPARRYPPGQDAPPGVISSIERYHQLLLRKYGSSTTQAPQEPTTTKTVTVALRKRPKSLKHIYSTINPKTKKVWKAVTSEVKNKPKKPVMTIATTTLPPPPATSTSTTKTTAAATTTTTSASTSLPRKIERVTFRPLRPRIDFVTTRKPLLTGAGAGQYSLRKTLWDYIWPNTELIAAIKDVFAKFKASLDEAGLDQDVRLMGNQLKNTWQQLRTGIDRGLRVVKQSAENSVQQMNGSLTPRELMNIGAVMSNSERGSRRIEIPAVDSKLERLDQILGPVNEQIGRIFENAAADTAESRQRAIRN